MLPALLGNIIGGGLFVAVVYWYLFLVGDTAPTLIDGDGFNLLRPEPMDRSPSGSNDHVQHSHHAHAKSAEAMV